MPHLHKLDSGCPKPARTRILRGRLTKETPLPKRTYQPKRIPRRRRHGFLHRMADAAGRRVIRARRAKGRKRLVVV